MKKQMRNLQKFRYFSSDNLRKYKNDSETITKWLDFSVFKNNGRIFEPSASLIDEKIAETFPKLASTNLNGLTVSLPDGVEATVKLIAISFNENGHETTKSWTDPFIQKFQTKNINSKEEEIKYNVVTIDVNFVDFSFLSFARSIFVTNLKKNADQAQHQNIFLNFGGVLVFIFYLFAIFIIYCLLILYLI
jgi:hypothetical protein